MRDEFDPLFGNRVGWYQRPMSPSRVRVAQALENIDEPQLREIVMEIISGRIQNEEEDLDQLLNIIPNKEKKTTTFILRAPTGKLAESFFQKHFSENKVPISGRLVDCRDLGVGYDFRIETNKNNYFIEVKGLSDFSGGILFTNKEWTVARHEKEKYFLCVVSNLAEKPEIIFIKNPAKLLTPKKNIFTSIQINWSVTQNQLGELHD